MGGSRGVTGITVLGDVLRPSPDGTPGGVDNQALWLHDAVHRQIGQACGLTTAVLSAGSPGELHDWVRALRRPDQAHALWATCHASLHTDPFLEGVLAEALENRFVVGYELPPYLLRLLAELSVPHIDLRVHPVRFMDDLLFAARASEPETRAALLRDAVPEGEVIATAGLRQAMLRYRSRGRRDPDSLLAVGQARHDSSQIFAGSFFDPAAALPEVERVCGLYPSILLKRHPNGEPAALLDLVRSLRPDAEPVEDNVYHLLAHPDVAAVLTVNSSVAVEAAYFGKEAHVLAPPPIRIAWRGAAPGDAYASIDDVFLTADFWRGVLAPHAAVTAPDGVRLASKPNRLRLALASFWNYQQIDTDLIPHPVEPGPASSPPPPRGLLARASSGLLHRLCS